MVKKNDAQNSGIWGDYHDKISQIEVFFAAKKGECPKGVSLIHEKVSNKHYLSFRFNLNGVRTKKKTGEDFSEVGIVQAVIKAGKIADVLSLIAKNKFALSDFDSWYDTEILGVSEPVKLLTYREIFSLIEDKYFSGKNRNTGRQRKREGNGSANDFATFDTQYGKFFAKFPDWDKIPSWTEIWTVWESYSQGTKTFTDMKTTVTAIIRHMPNCDELMKKINKVDCTQTEFREKQFVNLDEFLAWWDSVHAATPSIKHRIHREARPKWLWVCAMSVVYGLRPSEIAAAQNLTKPFTKDGETVYALTDEVRNPEALLVIGDFTYFGASTKTGMRVIAPVPDKGLWERLQIRNPMLPKYQPKPGSKPGTVVTGFDRAYGDRLANMKCPISQKYAFRHLYNLLGELYGWPQEYRSRNMGHTLAANEIYKDRFDFKADVALAKSGKQHTALPYDLAITKLQELGVDTDLPDVKLILRTIYQLD